MKTNRQVQMNFPQSSIRPEKPRNSHEPQVMRIYVKVTTDFDATGMMTPKAITWSDGRVFPIEAVTDFRPASTLEPGKSGDCYTVIIKGERKHLFFQKNRMVGDHRIGRWWVEVISL